MKRLIEYITQDYIYNIIDSDELHIFNKEKFQLWYNLGFTQGLLDEAANICSNALDAMLHYLLHYNEETKVDMSDFEFICSHCSTYHDVDSNFSLVALPLVRRLYAHGVVVESKKLHELYDKLYPSIWRKYKYIRDSGMNIDAEAEAVALLTRVIVKRVKQNKKKRKNVRKRS